MIKDMDVLLIHWGEQYRRNGETSSMGSPMAAIIEWGGCAPRGTPGSRIILGAGVGPDAVAQEVGAALSEIARDVGRGERLDHFGIEARDNGPRHAGQDQHAVPDAGLVAGQ